MGFDDRAADREPHAHAVRAWSCRTRSNSCSTARPAMPDTAVDHGAHAPHRRRAVSTSIERAPGEAPLIASMPFTTRFTITCWIWTRSTRSDRAARRAVHSMETSLALGEGRRPWSRRRRRRRRGRPARAGCRRGPRKRRMPVMTSLARLASRTIRWTASMASRSFFGSWASQRRQAWPLATTAASGWLTSCAIDAASSPMAVARVTRASSA